MENVVVMLVIMWHLYNTVLEPGVLGSWEDVVGAAELSDAPQTVEFQGVPAVCQGEHHFYCQHHKHQHYHFHVLDMILDIVY